MKVKDKNIRPTADKVKETLFNILASRINFDGLIVLELFAGTGSLGFEAISRGAEKVVFVDTSQIAIKTIRENAKLLNCETQVEIVREDAINFIDYCAEKFDLILADPPYNYEMIDELVHKVGEKKILSDIGYFALEHDSRISFSPDLIPLQIETRRNFGKTALTIFKYRESER